MNFDLDTYQWNAPWDEPERAITNFTAGLYHRQTGSRLLFGVLDEWGLSARIRNPWIRSPPYADNHRPLMADLRVAASGTREDQLYLYLSTPVINVFPDLKLRGFVSSQVQVEDITNIGLPTFSGGMDFDFGNKTNLLLEAFYTGKTLPPRNANTWFSDPPSLPERDFHLYAAGVLFSSPAFSISSDFAYSETFAWGNDIYCNLGLSITPLLQIGRRARPLMISLAADGSGERFVNRDGVNLNEGFRSAAKIEWRGRQSSLLRVNSVLRADNFGEEFNRSSTAFYYRFPAQSSLSLLGNNFPIRLTRISLSTDRNAVNPASINDSYSGTLGLNINMQQLGANSVFESSPLRLTFTGSIKGVSESGKYIFPMAFYHPENQWNRESISTNCEFFWSPYRIQLRSRVGITFIPENDKKWDFSLSSAIRIKQGRLSLRVASPDFPEKWNWSISWRLEKR
jgi:hypothetical protein